MAPPNEIGRTGRETPAAGENPIAGSNRDGWKYSTSHLTGSTIRGLIVRRLWVWSYRLEETRQRYTDQQQALRHGAAHLAQVLLLWLERAL